MPDVIGIGIVGAGIIGQVHANALKDIDGARIVAVADPREDAGRSLADSHGAAWYSSYTDLLANDDVSLVILATPSGLHADQTVLAAQAGKHIVTEKPMAITADGLDRMIQATEEAGVELAVIFQNRLSADIIRVKRGVEAGMLGTTVFGNASVHWFRDQDYYGANGGWRGTWELDGGGALMNQSIHTIDLAQWIMGGVASVSADIATLNHDIETEDTATATVRYNSGALGTIQGSTAAGKDWPVRVEIVGTGGKALIEGGRLVHWEGDSDLTDDVLTAGDLAFVEGWTPGEPFGASHRRQLRLIIAALRDGDTPPVPAREARKAVDVILAIYKSAKHGQRVTIA
ncbi:MAG: Gfo/Idh/MocA family oxidoreductase [Chloroflexota bacterium]|nr:Gfo/Idh/MocA family oxidoreductase [Chloroflexota bacterium]